MRKYLRYILGILALVLVISCTPSINTSAGSKVNGDSGDDGGKTPASELKAGSISQHKSGVLCYITSGHMYTISKVVFIPYSQIPNYKTIGTDMLRARDFTGDASILKYPKTLKQVIKDYSGIDWNVPPFSITSGTGIGSSLKSHLLEVPNPSNPDITYAKYFILSVFGQEMLDKMQANPDDYYLIFETVIWHGKQATDERNFAVTTPHVWNVFENRPSRFGYSTDAMNVPHSMYLPETWYIMEAVTPNFGHTEDVGELASPIKGFGMMMVKIDAPEEEQQTPQPPTISTSTTDDYLRANELNYIFADMEKDSKAMREENIYADYMDLGLESYWKKHTGGDYRNNKVKDGKWYILESITSDLVSLMGGVGNALYYRSGAGAYFTPSNAVGLKTVDIGSAGGSKPQYPGYGYNLTRSLWGDNLVISSFSSRGDNQVMKSWAQSVLKYEVGHDGKKTVVSNMTNQEVKIPVDKSASYVFTGKITEQYQYNDKIYHAAEYDDEYGLMANGKYGVTGKKKVRDAWYEDNWVNREEEYQPVTITRNLTHGLYKYLPFDITTVPNASAGNRLLATGHIGQAYSKVSFATQQAGVLKIYPEVKYEMWYMGGTETWSTPQKTNIYVMGEKQRSCKPAIIHGYNVYIQGGQMRGQTIVDSPLTGTLANDFSNSWSADGSFQSEYEVCTQGSGFETATTNAPKIDFASFGLDLNESSINGFTPKGTWESASPLDSHMGFVFAVLGNVDSEVKMRRYNQSNRSQGQEYDMSFDISDNIISSTTKQQIKIVFENGAVTTGKTEVINAIASAYGVSTSEATTIWNNSGIENQLREMMETSASANNNSGNVVETPDNWYDETSECLTITVCKTTVTFGKILLSDKHDYGSSTSQSETNITSVGNGGYQCRYFYSLKFTSDSINVDGFNLDVSGTKYLIHDNEIKGARFLVSNSTTSNMRK